MGQRTEGHFKGYDQSELFYQTWWSKESRGTLVITHGLAEHSDCYDHFAQVFNSPSWDVVAWDLRGHGRSEGRRGLIKTFQEYSFDLCALLKHLKLHQNLDKGPVILLGHSMGGLVTLRTIIDHKDLGVTGVALSSPLLGIAVTVPIVKDFASRMLYKVMPNLTMYNELKYEHLSRDPQMLKAYQTDPLRHEKISPALYLGMLETMAYVKSKASEIQLPLLMQLAGHDLVVSQAAAEELFSLLKMPNKKLLVYPESYHEIFNDLDHKVVVRDLNQFLEQFLKT